MTPVPLHVFELLDSGADFSARFTYEIKEVSGGIAQSLKLVDGLADEEELVYLVLDGYWSNTGTFKNLLRSVL